MSNSTSKKITPTNPGFIKDLVMKAKLVLKLMGDKRVNPLVKIIPIGSVLYLVFPADFMPLIPIDDIAVVGAGMYLFIELCPSYVVEEHLTNLRTVTENPFRGTKVDELIVDGEIVEPKPQELTGKE